MSYTLAIAGAVVIGICAAIEPAVNSGLGKIITPRLATLHSFLVGTLLILIINAASGGFKKYRLVTKAPVYLWIGGLLGLTVVYLGARVAPVIGVAATVTIMVSAQLVSGVVIDSLGLFGVEKVQLDISRIIGIIITMIGVKLVVK